MPSQTQIELYLKLNGGAPQTGVVSAAYDDVVVLSLGAFSSLAKKVKYRIRAYPPGFPCPAGWSTEGVFYTFTKQNGSDADSFALPTALSDQWGKFIFDAEINDGLVNGVRNGATYAKARLEIPSTTGAEDIAYLEEKEFDDDHGWHRALQAAARRTGTLSPISNAGYIPDWYVNASTGDDTNDGKTALTAFKTVERLCDVLCPGGATLTIYQNTTVHVAQGSYGRLRLSIDNPTAAAYFLSIVGEISSSVAIVLATVTNTASSGTRGRITTASGTFVDKKRVRCTVGAHAGACAFVTGLTSATDAFVSRWVDSGVNVVNLSVGDTVVVDTLLTNIAHLDLEQRSFGGIIVQDCQIDLGGVVQGPSQHDAIQLYRCECVQSGSDFAGVGTFVSTNFLQTTAFRYGSWRLFGNHFQKTVTAERSVLNLSQGNCFDGGSLTLVDNARAHFYANPSGDCEFENGSGVAQAILVSPSCSVEAESAALWGVTGNYTIGIRIKSGASFAYSTLPSIPSTTNANIAGTTKTWATLPFNDATHWAAAVQTA